MQLSKSQLKAIHSAQRERLERRRLAKLGINWRYVQKPYGAEGINLD